LHSIILHSAASEDCEAFPGNTSESWQTVL